MTNKLLVALFSLISLALNAQNGHSYPEIGKPCPDFYLDGMSNFSVKQTTLSKLKGKHTILDFWNKYCVVCIESFPKVNKLSEKFNKKLNIIVIGKQEEGIQSKFEKYRSKLNLKFPFAFDSALYRRFVPGGAPHLVWIDDHGIVQALTNSTDLTEENLQAFVEGRKFIFWDKSYAASVLQQNPLDLAQPLLVNGNGGESLNFQYRSLLGKWNRNTPQGIYEKIDQYASKGLYQGTGLILRWLYNLAYFGVYDWTYGDSLYSIVSPQPILSIKDTSLFYADFIHARGVYNYSVIVPPHKANREYLMKIMQKDLQCFFGYDVQMEVRKFPYWKLIATPEALHKLPTKGGTSIGRSEKDKFVAKNVPINYVLGLIADHQSYSQIPFIDETEIKGNIDIELMADILANEALVSFETIREALKKEGLSLIKGEKDMKVLVIKDTIQ